MNIRNLGILFLTAIVAVTVSGCYTLEQRKVRKKADYPVELLPSQHAYVKAGSGYEDNGAFVIEGKVRRSVKTCCSPVSGHVDVMIASENGAILEIITAPISPSNIPTIASRQSSFKVKLPYIPPPGASIRAKFHGKKFMSSSSEKTVNCRKNITAI